MKIKGDKNMINRRDFERDLCNNYGCYYSHGDDITLCREVNGVLHRATFGNHAKTEIHGDEARRLLQDLGFTGDTYKEIRNKWSI